MTEKTNLHFIGAQFFAEDEHQNHDIVFEAEDLELDAKEKSQEEGAEPGKEKPSQPETAGAMPENEPKYTVKYNGKEQALSLSQLIVHAQKGLNYDHIKQELEFFKAKGKGADKGQITEASGQTMGGTSPDFTAETSAVLPFMKLLKEYPSLTAETLPEPVLAAINQGKEPLVAYQSYENAQLREKVSVLENNRKNQSIAIGSAGSLVTDESDGFLDGLFGE